MNQRGPSQWDDAWSWAPLNEIAFQSMIKHEMNEDARSLAFDYSKMVITSFHLNQEKFCFKSTGQSMDRFRYRKIQKYMETKKGRAGLVVHWLFF